MPTNLEFSLLKFLIIIRLCLFFFVLIMLMFDLVDCHNRYCRSDNFNCGCKLHPWYLHATTNCIDRTWICDGFSDCDDGSDEIDCICSEDKFQCSECERGIKCQKFQIEQIFYCVSKAKLLDDKIDCWHEKDYYS